MTDVYVIWAAEALPLKHVIDGLSGALVTGEGIADNVADLVVLGIWTIAGIFFAVRGFQRLERDD